MVATVGTCRPELTVGTQLYLADAELEEPAGVLDRTGALERPDGFVSGL
jgi:hypothetical protein